MSDHDSGSSLAWFLAGAALGAAGALLFAPQSGRETREIIRQFVTDLDIPEDARQRLLELTPAAYVGNAAAMAKAV